MGLDWLVSCCAVSDYRRFAGGLMLAVAITQVSGLYAVPPTEGRKSERASAGTETIAELIAQLDDPSFAVREWAMTRLKHSDASAIEPLVAAMNSKKLEVVWRASKSLVGLCESRDPTVSVAALKRAVMCDHDQVQKELLKHWVPLRAIAVDEMTRLRAAAKPPGAAFLGGKIVNAGYATVFVPGAIDLRGTQFTELQWRLLKWLPELQCIDFTGSNIADDDLMRLSHFRFLTHLNLSNTETTDRGLIHLSKLHHLSTLSLQSTRITAQGLVHLAEVVDLQFVDLSESKVTAADLCRLASWHDGCRIVLSDKVDADGLFIRKRFAFFLCGAGRDRDLSHVQQVVDRLGGQMVGGREAKGNPPADIDTLRAILTYVSDPSSCERLGIGRQIVGEDHVEDDEDDPFGGGERPVAAAPGADPFGGGESAGEDDPFRAGDADPFR